MGVVFFWPYMVFFLAPQTNFWGQGKHHDKDRVCFWGRLKHHSSGVYFGPIINRAKKNTMSMVFFLAPYGVVCVPKTSTWCFFRPQMVFFSALKEFGPEKVPFGLWWFCDMWCFSLPQTVLFRSPKVLILAPNGVFFCPKARFNSKRCFFDSKWCFFLHDLHLRIHMPVLSG